MERPGGVTQLATEIDCFDEESEDTFVVGKVKAYTSGRYSLILFMLDAGLMVQAKLEKRSVAELTSNFKNHLLNNISPTVVCELVKHDLKSSSDPR